MNIFINILLLLFIFGSISDAQPTGKSGFISRWFGSKERAENANPEKSNASGNIEQIIPDPEKSNASGSSSGNVEKIISLSSGINERPTYGRPPFIPTSSGKVEIPEQRVLPAPQPSEKSGFHDDKSAGQIPKMEELSGSGNSGNDEKTPEKSDDPQMPPIEKLEISDKVSAPEPPKSSNSGSSSTSTQASVLASKRLQKEILELFKSANYKEGKYSIDIVDNIYKWHLKIREGIIDKDSRLAQDMRKLAQPPYNQDHLLFEFTFTGQFPIEPPFVRLVSPVISGGHVMRGGAICMELLTPEGWASAYTVEAIIMQIAAEFVKDGAQISFGSNPAKSYTMEKAKKSFAEIHWIHKKGGWRTPPKKEGRR